MICIHEHSMNNIRKEVLIQIVSPDHGLEIHWKALPRLDRQQPCFQNSTFFRGAQRVSVRNII